MLFRTSGGFLSYFYGGAVDFFRKIVRRWLRKSEKRAILTAEIVGSLRAAVHHIFRKDGGRI